MSRRSIGWAAVLSLGLAACGAPEVPTAPAPDPGTGGGAGDTAWPLLDGVRGGNYAANFCAGKPDSAALPVDPRTLIKEGVNAGKAVAFNAYWKDCPNIVARPTTCGEFRAMVDHGRFIGEGQGEVGTPVTFAGGQAEPGGLDAELYNNIWQTVWELPERPHNFDELIAERYGSPRSVGRNPYPLPGEDPNETGGGSGQLPLILTQIRRPDGSWTGQIGTKVCVLCHNGQLGTEADGPGMGTQFGGAGSIGDFTVQGYDFDQADGDFAAPSPTSAITISTNRGTGAIDFFQLAFILFSNGNPELLANEKIVASQAIGNIKSPPWWNLAYRAQKFHGAVLHTDSSRIDLAAYYDLARGLGGDGEGAIRWVDENAPAFQVWAESLPSPEFPAGFCSNADGTPAAGDHPHCINRPMAEAGAVLFHELDLWASGLDNPVARPDHGNGSCASCHGAYSPRYVHDTRFLERPELAGIAAYTVPMSIVGTDPVYADAMQSLRRPDGSTSDAILQQDVVYCGLGNAANSPGLVPIMLAPPLWGIWASAPYFHNGSVPNIEGVLDAGGTERPRIWRRLSTPLPAGQEGLADKIVMGFDTSLARAYDYARLGWKYDALACSLEDPGTAPVVACNPADETQASPVQLLLGALYTQFGATWNLPRLESMTMTKQDIENRKIFNTHLYSQGNQGHAFTSVLTDAQRRWIIEYLKTL
jgi:hypothetical protein